MKIIDRECIDLHLDVSHKDDVIRHMAGLLENSGRLAEKEVFIKAVLEREMLSTTGIGFGVAIPHGKSDAVKVPTVAFGKCQAGLNWASLDNQPVTMVFLIAVPSEAASNQHLKILAALSRKLLDEQFRQRLFNSEDKQSVLDILEDVLMQAAA